MRRGEEPFFSRAVRQNFRHSLKIPRDVCMWLTGFQHMGSGRLSPYWYEHTVHATKYIKLYVCTYAVGHLVFQVVSARYSDWRPFMPSPGFEHLSIPFWPTIENDVGWMPLYSLRNAREYERFAARWREIRILA